MHTVIYLQCLHFFYKVALYYIKKCEVASKLAHENMLQSSSLLELDVSFFAHACALALFASL